MVRPRGSSPKTCKYDQICATKKRKVGDILGFGRARMLDGREERADKISRGSRDGTTKKYKQHQACTSKK